MAFCLIMNPLGEEKLLLQEKLQLQQLRLKKACKHRLVLGNLNAKRDWAMPQIM